MLRAKAREHPVNARKPGTFGSTRVRIEHQTIIVTNHAHVKVATRDKYRPHANPKPFVLRLIFVFLAKGRAYPRRTQYEPIGNGGFIDLFKGCGPTKAEIIYGKTEQIICVLSRQKISSP